MAQATPPPSHRATAGRRITATLARASRRLPAPGFSCGEDRPRAPDLTAQAQIRPPICLLSGQESGRRGDRPVILSSAHTPTADSGPIANPASGIACAAQDHNPRWDHPRGPLNAGALEVEFRWFTLAPSAVADLAGTAADGAMVPLPIPGIPLPARSTPLPARSITIAAGPAFRTTKVAAGRLAPRTAETYCEIPADPALRATNIFAANIAPPSLARFTLVSVSVGPGGTGLEDRSQRGARNSPQDVPECLPSWNWARQGACDVIKQFTCVHTPAPFLRFSVPSSPRGRAPGSRRLPARGPS